MDHESMKAKLWELYDGELSGRDREEAEAHLKTCAECAALFARWKTLSGKLFGQAHPARSEAFVQNVMSRVRQAEVTRVPIRVMPVQWFAPVFGIAAMLLLAITPAVQAPSAENMFMGDASDAVTQWVFMGNIPQSDDLLSFVMEER